MLKKLERAGRRALARRLRGARLPDGFRQGTQDPPLCRIPEGSRLGGILFMRWDAIGDMMVCLPWFRRVRELFPETRMGIVVSRRNAPLLRYEGGFRKILYDSRPAVYLRSLAEARRFGPDAIVDTRMHYDSTTSFLYGLVSGAEWLLSAGNRDNRLPYNVRVPMPEGRVHMSEMTRILLQGLGRELDDADLDRQPRLSASELAFAAAFRRKSGLLFAGGVTGINISARDPGHRWPMERVEGLCARLSELGSRAVLLSAPEDAGRAEALASRHSGIIPAPVCPTVLHAAALIRDLDMFVTPDTGLVHIASSYGIPTVGLYVPNEEHLPLWLPWRVENEVLMAEGEIREIEVDDVLEAMARLSSRTGSMEFSR